MYEILMVGYLVVAVALVGFILVQQGKGAGMGASFGSGASGTVFGAGGSGNFLTKTTTILAIVFFGVALALGNLTTDKTTAPDEDDLFANESVEQTIPENDIPTSDIPVESSSEELPTVEEHAGDLPTEDNSTQNDEMPAVEDAPKEDDGTN
ncbi:MAG: preprotein translocase subunit SecG [Gammaproteobacteria bacterium]|nr:preprotein translocase subunit SecG [Gammaproteobacteria bacterium]